MPEYWIVDVVNRLVEMHDQPKDDRYSRVRHSSVDSEPAISVFPDVTVSVKELFPSAL